MCRDKDSITRRLYGCFHQRALTRVGDVMPLNQAQLSTRATFLWVTQTPDPRARTLPQEAMMNVNTDHEEPVGLAPALLSLTRAELRLLTVNGSGEWRPVVISVHCTLTGVTFLWPVPGLQRSLFAIQWVTVKIDKSMSFIWSKWWMARHQMFNFPYWFVKVEE